MKESIITIKFIFFLVLLLLSKNLFSQTNNKVDNNIPRQFEIKFSNDIEKSNFNI